MGAWVDMEAWVVVAATVVDTQWALAVVVVTEVAVTVVAALEDPWVVVTVCAAAWDMAEDSDRIMGKTLAVDRCGEEDTE